MLTDSNLLYRKISYKLAVEEMLKMFKFPLGTRVQITGGHHRTGEIGYVEKIGLRYHKGQNYFVKFKDGQISTFFESGIEEKSYIARFKKTPKYYMGLGSISTAFYEAGAEEILKEAAETSAIREVAHNDVTGKHFIDWFFKMPDFADISPKDFPFPMIVHCYEFNTPIKG
jgi:hypothetical protein